MRMIDFRLRLGASADTAAEPGTFYWSSDERSSFRTSLSPTLGVLGPVRVENVDLVRIAAAVYAADRSSVRTVGRANWRARDLSVDVDVALPDVWRQQSQSLAALVNFLSGDRWNFTFSQAPELPDTQQMRARAASRVVLLSGGADSAVGALKSRETLTSDQHHVLVSHSSASTVVPVQEAIATRAESAIPGPSQDHEIIQFARKRTNYSGRRYGEERSTRTRSLLFLALGLAVASIDEVDLWIPENGFASINPPLGPDRRGSLSTRTTHPAFLGQLSALADAAGAHATIVNPFAGVTKGEMFTWARERLGGKAASEFLSASHSCSHTDQRFHGVKGVTGCGVCFGCVLRRAAFKASDIQDASAYAEHGRDADLDSWLESKSVEAAVREFVRSGVSRAEIAASGLPYSYSLREAHDLVVRGISELRDYIG